MKNICPNCSQVTISLGDEAKIRCPVCEVVFEVDRDTEEKDEV